MVRELLKWWLVPGINLHARLRYRVLPRVIPLADPGGDSLVLDAGCGNGMLTYQAYVRGHRALGISIKDGEVERNRRLFNVYLGVPEDRLSFRVHNLYEVESLGMQFDQITCSEVLEHIPRDEELCRMFWRVLKPGGALHLCCPDAEHPDHVHYLLDPNERGGHVRPGYTEASYRALLEPIGFEVSTPIGLGGLLRQWCNKQITRAQHLGDLRPGWRRLRSCGASRRANERIAERHIRFTFRRKRMDDDTARRLNNLFGVVAVSGGDGVANATWRG